MDFNAPDRGNLISKPARQLINKFVPEDARLPRTGDSDHLHLLGDELGVTNILTRSLTGGRDEHPGIDAMLVPLPSGYTVVIDEKAPESRQHYSLAHELAHIMLLELESSTQELPKARRFRSSSSTADKWKAEERLCDEIAAELLMPEKLFTAEVREMGRSLEHMPQLAKLFRTSLTATAIRYWELLPEPCQLIRWRPTEHKRGFTRPTWQMRNKPPGFNICPITASSIVKRNEFLGVREAWKTMRSLVSRECLLAKYKSMGQRYVRPETFHADHIGFGNPANRTVISAVYLGRICETM